MVVITNFVFPTGNTGANPTVSPSTFLLASDGVNTGEATVQSLLGFVAKPLVTNGTVVTTGASYAVAATDYVVVVNKTTGSATAITLPASPASWRTVIIKDGKGDAATNNVTVTPASGTIDGAASIVLNNNYAAVEVVYTGSQWVII